MIFDENCCCQADENENNNCGCDCDHENDACCESGEDCGCDCGHEGHDHGEGIITMTDTETGESYTFAIADDFAFEDDHYCVLVTVDNERDPEMIIAKVVKLEDDSEGLMSLDDDEYDRVYAEYERLCEEEDDEDTETETSI